MNELLQIKSGEARLDPDWFSQALRYSGILDEGDKVVRLEKKALTGGLMASTYQVSLFYNNSCDSYPKSLVAKLPSMNADSLQAGREMRAYEREIMFYREFSQRLKMRLPRCYFAMFDKSTADFALLLEDISPAISIEPGSCTLDQSILCMQQLALLHASTWGDTTISKYDWVLDYTDKSYFKDVKRWAEAGWKQLRLVSSNRVPEVLLELGDFFIDRMDLWQSMCTVRGALIHCDYRLANIIHTLDGEESVTLDWQTIHWGLPSFDLGYFIANTYRDEQRQEVEAALIKAYHSTLVENGVSNYSLDACMSDYRLGSLYPLLMLMVTTHGVASSEMPEPVIEQLVGAVEFYWPLADEYMGDFLRSGNL